ncbi:hypothetical protein J2X97_003281 [Epilithonimonas hungarica]|uniref:hypothetical protein n=1 Tax=Epilithonimonas hungarica TaxID=454006 RepID=UPI00277F0668|nr:hypothetical protein [Epilithonimonas hungarica]MDP9957612.1 hypothetical protein [Epilithonimonas hungarica]
MKNKVILISLFAIFQSCIDCEKSTKIMAEDECDLVIEIPPLEYTDLFKTKGYDPVTKEKKVCINSNRWWSLYKNEIEEGDTIVKKKGDLVFYIHKKDTVIAHEWVCYDGDGKHTYNK